MNSFAKGFVLWLALASIATILSGTLHLSLQQAYRMSANDPQIQIAEDVAAVLQSGKDPVEAAPGGEISIEKSLAPYVVVYDTREAPLAGNGKLYGEFPHIPNGVLSVALNKQEYTVTWEPEEGLRQALAIVAYTNGYVVSGRSLRLVEERSSSAQRLVVIGWLVSLIVSLILVVFARFMKAL